MGLNKVNHRDRSLHIERECFWADYLGSLGKMEKVLAGLHINKGSVAADFGLSLHVQFYFVMITLASNRSVE